MEKQQQKTRWAYKYIGQNGNMAECISRMAFENVSEMVEYETNKYKGHGRTIIPESARPYPAVITTKHKYYVFTKSRYSGGNSEYGINGGIYTPSKNPNPAFGTWRVVVGHLSTWGYWIAGFETIERAEGHARITGGDAYTAKEIKEFLTGMGLDQIYMPEGDGYISYYEGFTWPPAR